MGPIKVFPGRKLRVCYWNTDPKLVTSERMALEQHLSRLGEVDIHDLRALDDPSIFPCDILVIGAQRVSEADFVRWLTSLQARMIAQGGIWIPALIVAEVGSDILNDVLPSTIKSNWYFDVVAPTHLSSLPIRVANMLRLHDHLHEMRRYSEAIEDMQSKVNRLEAQISSMSSATEDQDH